MAEDGIIRRTMRDLDIPLEEKSVSYGFFKKSKMRVFMIYEDQSFREFWVKSKNPYVLTIRKRRYILIPECIIRGAYSTIFYYFNNPYPISMPYEKSKVTALDMVTVEQKKVMGDHMKNTLSKISLDSGTLDVAFSSNLINKMYAENRLTPKVILIFIIVGFLIVLILLQVTGKVDVIGALRGMTKW